MTSFLPALLLFAAGASVDTASFHDVIPRHNWGYHDLSDVISLQEPADVRVEYTVESGPLVRLELVRHEGIERLTHGKPYAAQASTGFESTGAIHVRLPDPTDYAVVIDNRGSDSTPATVRLKVFIDYAGATQSSVRRLSQQRQLAVIAISFSVFFGIVAFSARTLWRSANRGPSA